MSGSQTLIKKRESRIKRRKNERQELFISDYVKHKYKDIYAEAAQVYEILNKNYPRKQDIRKTNEHKAWKKHAVMQHPAYNIHQAYPSTELAANPEPHPNIEPTPTQPSSPQPSPIMEATCHQTLESPQPTTPPGTFRTQTTEETLQTGQQYDHKTGEQVLINLNDDPTWKDILDGTDIENDNDLQNYLETCQFW